MGSRKPCFLLEDELLIFWAAARNSDFGMQKLARTHILLSILQA